MTPILGIIASSNFRVPTAYESIATVTVGSGGSASISFTSIPGTYTHLQVRCLARTNRALTADQLRITVNSDSASNYSDHILSGDGSSATASAVANNTYMFLGRASAATATASIFGATIIDILDYANTNKYKTLRSLTGVDFNGTGNMSFTSGSWRNTAAITSIQVTFLGSLMNQYSSFALYGIKGA